MKQPEFTDEAAKDLNDIHDYMGEIAHLPLGILSR